MGFTGKIIIPDRLIVSAAMFFVTFSAVFVGDFNLVGLHAFFPIFLCVIFLRAIVKVQVGATEIISFFAMSFLFLTIMAANIASVSSYYLVFLFSVLFLFVIPAIEWLLERVETTYFCFVVLMAMLPLAFLALIFDYQRASLVFGPNIYYRVIGYIYVMFLLTSLLTGGLRRYRLLLLVVASLSLLTTGSRGSVPILIFLVILYVKAEIKHSRHGMIKASLLVVCLAGFLFYYLEFLKIIFWRLFYYDLKHGPIQDRLAFLHEAKQYVESIRLIDLLFGNGENQKVFHFYPHNIFLESFVYHGIFVMAIFCVFAVLFLCVLFLPIDGRYRFVNLTLLFSPIFLGSLVSGSFFEAYTIAAVAVLLLTRTLSRTPRRQRETDQTAFLNDPRIIGP